MIRWLDGHVGEPVRWLDALPSGESATELIHGDASALPKVLFHTTVRAGLIALAMYAVGMHSPKNLVKYSAAGALGIEAFVLLWALYEKQKESKA